MALEPAYALQRAFYAALNVPAVQTAAGVPFKIYDRVPNPAVLPYVRISDNHDVGDWSQGYPGSAVHATLHVWSGKPGKAEAAAIAAAVKPAILAQLPLADHRIVTFTHESTQFLDDPGGELTHGVIMVEYVTSPLV